MKKSLLGIAWALLMITAVNGQVVKYSGLSNLNFSTDSSGFPPRPVWVNINDVSDTGRVVTPDSVELEWPYYYVDTLGVVQHDSTKCIVELLVSKLDSTYNPSGFVWWRDKNGFITSEPIQFGPAYAVAFVDTVGTAVVISGGAGSGAYQDTIRVVDTSAAPDDTMTNVRVVIDDYGRVRKADFTIDGSEKRIANLDDEPLTFRVGANWYFQDGGVDTIVAPAKDTAFTLKVYQWIPMLLPGGDSCLVLVYTDNAYAQTEFIPNTQKFQNTQGTFLNPKKQLSTADVNGIVQRALPVTDSTMQKTRWTVKVWGSDATRPLIAEIPDYIVPAQSIDTLEIE